MAVNTSRYEGIYWNPSKATVTEFGNALRSCFHLHFGGHTGKAEYYRVKKDVQGKHCIRTIKFADSMLVTCNFEAARMSASYHLVEFSGHTIRAQESRRLS